LIPEKRYLVTTSDERSWKFDRPILFLGEWCRLYDRKGIWSNMDVVVAEPYGVQEEQKAHDISYIQSLSGQLLKELTDALNTFHGTSHSLRYWEIVLGHWLQRYVAVIFNRYFTLAQALDKHEVTGTTIFDSSTYSLATTDSIAFIWACNDEVWNHVLYSKILECWGNMEAEIVSEPLQGVCGFTMQGNSRFGQRKSVKRFTLDFVNKIWHKLSRKADAFIVNSFLPLKEEAKLQLSFGQFPQLWRSPKLEVTAPDLEKRRCFGVDAGGSHGFERFIRAHVSEVIPVCYLEGYNQLVQQIKSLPWPTKPRFVFTANNFDTDEIFKVWVAQKVEEGRPYFTGQHGNNYGTHLYLGNQYWPEIVTCDKFFTWGWTNGSFKNIPAFVFTTVGCKSNLWSPSGGLLLIELHASQQLDPWDSVYEFNIYQEEQFRFVAALPEHMQQKLTARLHHAYKSLKWSDEKRWKDRCPHTKIETGIEPILKLRINSRLVVHSYDSSGILETLALNIPTLCFWHGGLDHLLPSAKPYYELLRSAGIFHETPESAALKVAAVWDDVAGWWESQEVQDARKAFCNQYARSEKRPIRTLKRLLTRGENHEAYARNRIERR